jgi:beta-glucosidase
MDYQALEKAVEEGIITENQINLSLSRLLKARFELGLMDEESLVSWSKIPYTVVDSGKHNEKALEMARKSITLLRNEKWNITFIQAL